MGIIMSTVKGRQSSGKRILKKGACSNGYRSQPNGGARKRAAPRLPYGALFFEIIL